MKDAYLRKYSGACCFVDCHVFRKIHNSFECKECLQVDNSPKYKIICDNASCTQNGEIHQTCFATLEKNCASRLKGYMKPAEIRKAIWTYEKLRPFKKCFCGGNLDCKLDGSSLDIDVEAEANTTKKKKSRENKTKTRLPSTTNYDTDIRNEEWVAQYLASNAFSEKAAEERAKAASQEIKLQSIPTKADFPDLVSPPSSSDRVSSHYQSRVLQRYFIPIPQLISRISGPAGEKLTVRTTHKWLCHLYGRNGRNIKTLRDKSKCSIHVEEECKKVCIIIKGKTPEDQSCGVKMVSDSIQSIIKRLDKEQISQAKHKQGNDSHDDCPRKNLNAQLDLNAQLELM